MPTPDVAEHRLRIAVVAELEHFGSDRTSSGVVEQPGVRANPGRGQGGRVRRGCQLPAGSAVRLDDTGQEVTQVFCRLQQRPAGHLCQDGDGKPESRSPSLPLGGFTAGRDTQPHEPLLDLPVDESPAGVLHLLDRELSAAVRDQESGELHGIQHAWRSAQRFLDPSRLGQLDQGVLEVVLIGSCEVRAQVMAE